MFKVSPDPKFTHTVKVRVPVDGGYKEETFKATFRVIPPEQVDAMDLSTTKGTVDFLTAIVDRLDDLGDAEGKPIEYSDAVFEQVLRMPYARRGLATAYLEGVSGARQGN